MKIMLACQQKNASMAVLPDGLHGVLSGISNPIGLNFGRGVLSALLMTYYTAGIA